MRTIVFAAVLAGCYDVPHPDCGFQCGPPLAPNDPGTCPDGYACLADRCRLITEQAFSCPAIEEPPEPDPPGVMAMAPMDGEVDVDLAPDILVTFDENVTNVSLDTFTLSTGGTFAAGTVGPLGEGARVFIFRTTANLERNATYTVTLTSGIRDTDGYPLPETSWSFSTIRDHEGPLLVVSSPTNGSGEVSLTARIACAFDEPLESPPPMAIRLDRDGVDVPVTLTLTLGNTVELDYGTTLEANGHYRIFVTDQIHDQWGNPAVPTVLSFDTIDTLPPRIIFRDPLPDAMSVPVDTIVVIVFDEDVGFVPSEFHLSDAGGEIAASVSYVPGGEVAIEPLAPLAPATLYTVTIDELADEWNNTSVPVSYSFTTAP